MRVSVITNPLSDGTLASNETREPPVREGDGQGRDSFAVASSESGSGEITTRLTTLAILCASRSFERALAHRGWRFPSNRLGLVDLDGLEGGRPCLVVFLTSMAREMGSIRVQKEWDSSVGDLPAGKWIALQLTRPDRNAPCIRLIPKIVTDVVSEAY
jgi:hypothetical protein